MIEDSTFEGWTSGPAALGYPQGSKLPASPRPGNLIGEVRSLPKADEESVKFALRTWPQGRADSFDRAGRVWTERATGIVYKLVRGNPLAGWDTDTGADAADLFVVEDDSIWFLRRIDRPDTRSVSVGTIGGVRIK